MKKTYFNHDSAARNDFRIVKLRSKLGYEGYGIFWGLLEMLFTEENKICISQYDILAYGLQCNPSILKQVVEDFDLFVIEDNCFYSRRLQSQIEDINSKSNKAKENAKKRWSMQSQCDRNASIVNKSISKVKKSKEDNLEKRASRFNKELFNLRDEQGYEAEAITNFGLYWTELNKSKSKMRFEMERTWDLKRRLDRWVNSSFNKTSKFPDWFDSETYKKLDATKKKEYEQHLKKLGWISSYSPSAGMVWNKPK
jgi:hypothetical protein